jgi:hypothetical protein
MTQIKPMPVHVREYYKAMRIAYTQRKEEALKEREKLIDEVFDLHEEVLQNYDTYLKYNINLSEFPEFINNEYKDGHFLKVAKGAYLNRGNDYELTVDLHHLLQLAEKQNEIVTLESKIELYKKILRLNANEYIRYIREFFNIVHKKLILEGCAYYFGQNIGDIYINRVKLKRKNKLLDYKATREKKKEILARGGRLFSKAQANFCEKNGIEYKYEDHRVYLKDEYTYEICLANRRFPDSHQYKFTPQDYRGVEVRGKTNKDLIELSGGSLERICEFPVDLKAKISMCNEIDKTLYTNFIRNENQTSYKYAEADR